jgi:hypothetical protein
LLTASEALEKVMIPMLLFLTNEIISAMSACKEGSKDNALTDDGVGS